MHPKLLMTIILPFLASGEFDKENYSRVSNNAISNQNYYGGVVAPKEIQDIQMPSKYKRPHFNERSFAAWLRKIRVREDNRVFLYNGQLKANQSAQFAVLDIPIGNKDLQQCADAIMRLRAQYLFDEKRFDEIRFSDNKGEVYRYRDRGNLKFEKYLEKVFAFCGTLSLEKQLKKVSSLENAQPGDILIKGGSPGHAVIIVDMAINDIGKKIYLLAQSYMPAQDIHILKNPKGAAYDPWFEISGNSLIHTPGWVFSPNQLRTW